VADESEADDGAIQALGELSADQIEALAEFKGEPDPGADQAVAEP
jgi:hypothetical protein